MKNTKEIFADGIGQIRFVGGMVRIDLISLDAGEEPDSKPVPVSKERIIMPSEGFLRSFDTMQRLIDQLLENGVVRKNENSVVQKKKG